MECTTRPHGRGNINQHVKGRLTTATSWGVYKLEPTAHRGQYSDILKDDLIGKSQVFNYKTNHNITLTYLEPLPNVPLNRGNASLFCTTAEKTFHFPRKLPVLWDAISFRALYPSERLPYLTNCTGFVGVSRVLRTVSVQKF